MTEPARPLMSADDFLLWCLDQEARYELVDGVPVEMVTGASHRHDRIVVNIIALLVTQLRDTPCRPATADIAVRTRARTMRRPDITVTCDPPRGDRYDADTTRLLVEVLSPSNRGRAWQRKMDEYRAREGLSYILLVESEAIGATLYHRAADATAWEPSDYETLADVIALPDIGCTLPLADIYRGW